MLRLKDIIFHTLQESLIHDLCKIIIYYCVSTITHELTIDNNRDAPVFDMCFSPNLPFIVNASGDCSVKMSDLETGKLIAKLEGHTASVFSVDVDHTGTLIASGGFDNTVRIWDTASHKLLATFHYENAVIRARFSPIDNRILAITLCHQPNVKFISSSDGTEIRRFEAERSFPNIPWSWASRHAVQVDASRLFGYLSPDRTHLVSRLSETRVCCILVCGCVASDTLDRWVCGL